MTINELIEQSHKIAVEKGWWDNDRPFAEQIALFHSEISEVLEEYRKKSPIEAFYYSYDEQGNAKPEGIPIELADLFIRVADTCGRYGIDLEQAIKAKMEFNKNRPYRHGGKAA